ncbi:MAG: FprA family A-type flavoprotein [Muribaculaceae bacterium]|nr:FprA family A-type flavoprotein [Muribaculaceae bacterium]
MRLEKITQHVYYIGVNDRTTVRFEAMWPLPYGVSYNSYLIIGDNKVAIIDGVGATYALEQIDHIRAILGNRQPDYLIINHMEPDHSGAIRMLTGAFPSITIVGNGQTLNMVNGYYGISDNTQQVKDVETLSLGSDCNLKFYLTPMVHWPETMMTYIPEDKVLFSGDGFGCFGALNGAVLDKDMNVNRYWTEMVRYYSNIVGKYGAFVQKAMAKLQGIEISTICSTHGPVWQENIEKVLNLYSNLSNYEPLDNGVTIIYGSMYGNTERVAETVADGLASAGIKEIEIFNSAKDELSDIIRALFTHRGVVLASPTYSDTLFPPMLQVMEAIKTRNLKNREFLIFGSHTWSPRAVNIMSRYIEDLTEAPVSLPLTTKQAPTDDFLAQCRKEAFELADKLNAASNSTED